MLELSCWSFTNYPGESVFPPLASQVNLWRTGQGTLQLHLEREMAPVAQCLCGSIC